MLMPLSVSYQHWGYKGQTMRLEVRSPIASSETHAHTIFQATSDNKSAPFDLSGGYLTRPHHPFIYNGGKEWV